MNGQKNVPAGEAGAVLTDDPDLASRIRKFISHGENWSDPVVGTNGRLNEVTACVAYYGLKITTDNGRAVIDYRNSSNGYYGGSLELAPE